MPDPYAQAIEEADDFAGGAYDTLDAPLRREWWGFKNGYIQGHRAGMAEGLS